MIKNKFLSVVLLFSAAVGQLGAFGARGSDYFFEHRLSNQVFAYHAASDDKANPYLYAYNRLRADLDLGWTELIELKLIADLEAGWGEDYLQSPAQVLLRDVEPNIPFEPYRYFKDQDEYILRSYLYRAYATVYLPGSSLRYGFQRIPMGVGRIWNPTDILNPANPLSAEPGERMGVYGYNYTLNLSTLTQLHVFNTLNKDSYTKDWGARAFSNIAGWDMAISAIRNEHLRTSGLELEREILSTGIAFRSEVALLENLLLEETYYRYVVGGDYMFANSLYLVVEYFHNGSGNPSRKDYDYLALLNNDSNGYLAENYLGIMASYELMTLMSASWTHVQNLDDGSYFVSPALSYSLTQNSDIGLGFLVAGGRDNTEFADNGASYYLKYACYF